MLLVRRQLRENSSRTSLEQSHCHSVSMVRHQQCPARGPPGCVIFNVYTVDLGYEVTKRNA
jgi:hypothetical protein